MTFMWYQGGRKVFSATIQRSGKITKSMLAVPGVSDGEVSTVKIDGSGWSKQIAPTGEKRAQVVLVGRVVAVPGDDVERRVAELGHATARRPTSRTARSASSLSS